MARTIESFARSVREMFRDAYDYGLIDYQPWTARVSEEVPYAAATCYFERIVPSRAQVEVLRRTTSDVTLSARTISGDRENCRGDRYAALVWLAGREGTRPEETIAIRDSWVILDDGDPRIVLHWSEVYEPSPDGRQRLRVPLKHRAEGQVRVLRPHRDDRTSSSASSRSIAASLSPAAHSGVSTTGTPTSSPTTATARSSSPTSVAGGRPHSTPSLHSTTSRSSTACRSGDCVPQPPRAGSSPTASPHTERRRRPATPSRSSRSTTRACSTPALKSTATQLQSQRLNLRLTSAACPPPTPARSTTGCAPNFRAVASDEYVWCSVAAELRRRTVRVMRRNQHPTITRYLETLVGASQIGGSLGTYAFLTLLTLTPPHELAAPGTGRVTGDRLVVQNAVGLADVRTRTIPLAKTAAATLRGSGGLPAVLTAVPGTGRHFRKRLSDTSTTRRACLVSPRSTRSGSWESPLRSPLQARSGR